MSKLRVGRIAGSDSVYEVRFEGAIQGVDELISAPDTDDLLAPGFVDVQVNGFAGVDYNDPDTTIEQIAHSIRIMFQCGVTRFFPTIITGSRERILGSLKNLVQARQRLLDDKKPEGVAIEAFHVEGPHISPEDGPRGAHPREHVRPPDFDEFQQWQDAADGLIRLVTVSPEWPEAPEYIRAVTNTGVVIAIGHTKATADQIRAAVDAGATMSTHLGNGAHHILHKTENYIWEQLAEPRLSPSFIIDGIHIPAGFIKAAIRAKGIEHSVLVTDAVMPALCEPGYYRLGSVDVELLPGGKQVVLRGGDRLAGSALRMDDAIGNTVRLGNISLHSALTMATINPSRVCRIPGRQKGVVPGEKADLVHYRWNSETNSLRVLETIVAGTTVYEAESAAA